MVPVFPFGHGLSYTTFKYDSLEVRSVAPTELLSGLQATVAEVTLQLTNTGKRDGHEVVQLYLAFPNSAGEPPKQLKAFNKVPIAVGQSEQVRFSLTQRDVSVWDAETHAWTPVQGEFVVLIGASAGDIRLTASFKA